MDPVAWRHERSYAAGAFGFEDLRDRTATIAVCVPAKDEGQTIAGVLEPLLGLRDDGLVDDVVVALSECTDDTPARARASGARVVDVTAVAPGPVAGKGDAVWRVLPRIDADIVCFVDGDLVDVDRHWIAQLAGPLLAVPELALVKGAFQRPFRADGTLHPSEGGRVTELVARPLLSLFYPELGVLRQPLSGQLAVRRELLASIPIWTGYALEVGVLIETWRRHGLAAIAESDLGVLHNAHQRLADLRPMADGILWCVAMQLEREGRLGAPPPPAQRPDGVIERPPVAFRAQ